MSTSTDMRDLYLAAERDILQNGSTTRMGDRLLTMADLPDIRAGRQEWERRVAEESRRAAGVARVGYAVANFSQ